MGKLVRDKIPNLIGLEGRWVKYRTLDDEEYGEQLAYKLQEEYKELLEAMFDGDPTQIVEECCDVLEVCKAIASHHTKRPMDLCFKAQEKANYKGGFGGHIYLEDAEDV